MQGYPGTCRKTLRRDRRFTRKSYGWARDASGKVLDRLGQEKVDKDEAAKERKQQAAAEALWRLEQISLAKA